MENIGFAFLLTLIAGMATAVGSCIAFFTPHGNTRFLAGALGFSAGVMIFISFTDLLPLSRELLISQGIFIPEVWVLGAFFAGIIITALIDMTIPSIENPHEIKKSPKDIKELNQQGHNRSKLLRLGLITAIILALHNFPEGMATFIAATQSTEIALSITVAIALHNIPEGIAISMPVFYATGSKKTAFIYSAASGLSEPAGAICGYLLMRPFMSDTLVGLIFAAIAGIMIYISFDELLPAARAYGKHHLTIIGLFSGMLLMGISQIIF